MHESSDELLRAAAIKLANDHVSAQLVVDLRVHELRPILLKGASLRDLVYEPDDPRISNDIDLLVDETSYGWEMRHMRGVGCGP